MPSEFIILHKNLFYEVDRLVISRNHVLVGFDRGRRQDLVLV